MASTTLALIYNHRYERNVDRLNQMYGSRFRSVVHLIPFATEQPSVLPVFSSSYLFQSHIAQAASQLLSSDADYYFFVGDDVMLNPSITEETVEEIFRLGPTTGFISEWKELGAESLFWYHLHRAYPPFLRDHPDVDLRGSLPPVADAFAKVEMHGYRYRPLTLRNFMAPSLARSRRAGLTSLGVMLRNLGRVDVNYPVAVGYSDVVIIPRACLERFAYLCGVLAAGNVFVEAAIPTALLLSCDQVQTLRTIGRSSSEFWGAEEIDEFENNRQRKLSQLFTDSDSDTLWYHPVKLSRWDA